MNNKMVFNPIKINIRNSLFLFQRRTVGGLPPSFFMDLGERLTKRFFQFGDLVIDSHKLQKFYNSLLPPRAPSPRLMETCTLASKDIPIVLEESTLQDFFTLPRSLAFVTFFTAGITTCEYFGINFSELWSESPQCLRKVTLEDIKANKAFDSIFQIPSGYDPDSKFFLSDDIIEDEKILVEDFLNEVQKMQASYLYESLTETSGLTIAHEYNDALRKYITKKQMVLEKKPLYDRQNQKILEIGLAKIKPFKIECVKIDVLTRLESDKLIPEHSNFYLK